MEPLEVISYTTHALFAGLWTGSVIFVTLAVLPLARDGELNATPLAGITGKLTTISRASSVVLLLTGIHMGVAGDQYTTDTLLETQHGLFLISMVVLWIALMAAVEIGTSRLTAGTERDKVRSPARNARIPLFAASVFAAGLLLVSGLLSANAAGFL